MANAAPLVEPISKSQHGGSESRSHASDEAQKGERLIITRMVLENFKSWGGTKEIGPFHKNFSAVVGANGSGKSNIIDAMLFVFGKRAKQLRHNKVSELIHVSDQYPHLEQAKVSVYFQTIRDKPGDDYDLIPGSELVITRTATKSNQSKYYLNDKTSSWGEITDLLKRRGIDLDNNRFLILQGEVEQISLMKPKAPAPHDTGLLEYLEDIIGTNVYVEKIEAAAKVVEERNEERAEKLNRVRVVERERDGLEGARAEAEEFLGLERRIAAARSALLQHDRAAAVAAARARQESVANLQSRLAADQQRSQAAHDALAGLETRYGTLRAAHDALAAEMGRAKEDFAVFERKDVRFHEDLKHLKKKEKKLGEQLLADQKKADEAAAALAAHRDEAAQLEAQEKEANVAVTAVEKKLDELQAQLRGATAELHVQLEARQRELMPHAKVLTERENAVRGIHSELQLVQDRATAAQAALADAKQRQAELAPRLKQQQADAAACLAQLQTARKELAAAQKAAAEAAAADESAHSSARVLRQRAEAARSAAAATRARSTVLDALLEAKRQKQLDGIHGRLGDLATIDPKYDVAVSTACGALDHVLVQTAEQAQKCVAFLRKKQLGTATFLILDKQSSLVPEMQKPFAAPEQSQRLFDLVKPKKDEYLPALYYALRDTLVAADLDTATRLAFAGARRHRVVTIDGKLIDASGTMSGGGNRVARGLMALSSQTKQTAHAAGSGSDDEQLSEAELKALEAEAARQEEAQRAARTAAFDARARVQELVARVAELELQHQKLELALPALAATRTDLDARMPQLEAAAKPTAAEQQRVKDLQAALDKAERALEEARAAAAGVQKKIADVQAQIDNAGGGKLKQQKEKLASLQATADDVAKRRTKATVQGNTAEKNISKAKAALEAHKTELDEVLAEHRRVRDEFDKLTKDAEAVMLKTQQTQALLSAKAEELKATQAEYERAKATVTEIKKAELEINLQLEDAARFIKEQQQIEATANRKLAELQRHLKRLLTDDDEQPVAKDKDAMEGAEAEKEKEKDELPVLSEAELGALDLEATREEIALHEQKKNQMKPNMGAIREYRRKHAEHAARTKELEAVTEARDQARRVHDELRKQRLQEFMAGFSVITLKLKEMYQMITLGGDAELELVDSLDPFSEGIVFSVRPPRKNWKNIQNLSGGEKTLSSLALVFALHHYKPTPLYVMDEIDAALDFKNVSIVANYIKERTKNAQFVIISLRNNMFEIADRMVGVYKTHHVSKSVTINPNSFQIPVK